MNKDHIGDSSVAGATAIWVYTSVYSNLLIVRKALAPDVPAYWITVQLAVYIVSSAALIDSNLNLSDFSLGKLGLQIHYILTSHKKKKLLFSHWFTLNS